MEEKKEPSTELIITEKPSAAKKIAEALSNHPLKKTYQKKIPYYELTYQNKKILIAPTIGHLFNLTEKKTSDWQYPTFDITWQPIFKISSEAKYAQSYFALLSSLAKKAKNFIVACDYDLEGEVIGWNIIRFICQQKDAQRMKFSTLTKTELIDSYENRKNHLDWGQAYAGETRHKLDWFYGINLSRALTSSIKAAGSFKIMSIGRVQGPTLKLLVEREKEIEKFKPLPYWQLKLKITKKGTKTKIEAEHIKDKFWKKEEVSVIWEKIKKEKKAFVKDITKKRTEQKPLPPFDLTTLQTEAYRNFKITPKETLEIAQNLYLAGVISYPRTSSQQLDPKIGFKKIIQELSKQKEYFSLCQELTKNKLLPHNGKKTDPAHPAIFPTGIPPQKEKTKEKKIYDLIVRRFLATFGKSLWKEIQKISFEVKGEIFIAKGIRITEKGWGEIYQPYLKLEELTLPELKKGEEVDLRKIEKVEKETQPPKRYTQSSLIREMDKRCLGTKATRSEVLDKLLKRGYIEGTPLKVTLLGKKTFSVLEKYAPPITNEKLTRKFEEKMEKISKGQYPKEEVLKEAQEILIALLKKFKEKEREIGEELLKALRETQEKEREIGKCLLCQKGTLILIKSKKTKRQFIACSRYPDCKATFSLPQNCLIKKTTNQCKECGYPKIQIIRKGKRSLELCIHPQCNSKGKKRNREEKIEREGETCPQCKKGKLILKKGLYGEFLACNKFPRCKYTEKIN